MSLTMPAPEAAILENRDRLIRRLRALLPDESVIAEEVAMRAYECDALTMYRQLPLVVALPETVAQVQAIMALAAEMNVKVVPRGAGTSLSGGSLPLGDGILLAMGKFNRILEIDYDNRCARVQPGVANLAISDAVADRGFYYAPDPSSQIACSIGGNVGENSGGVHCLKYGLTTNNILGLEIVLMGGEIVHLGGKHLDSEGYDLMGLMTGSEGLLGVITEVTVRLLRKPEIARGLLLAFPTVEAGATCVADIIAAGIIPGGLEMMDGPAIRATEDFQPCGYPRDAASLLICELDGEASEVDHGWSSACPKSRGPWGRRRSARRRARTSGSASGPGARTPSRPSAPSGPDYLCMDGTIPRGRLAEVLAGMSELAERHGLRVANVFHAGDGNLHPLILYDANRPGDIEKAEAFGADILKLCVAVGGVLTGEHGVGVEKRDLMGTMFTEADLDQQQRVKCAFDPEHRLNPGKVFPTLRRCAELGRMHVRGGALPFPDLPRF